METHVLLCGARIDKLAWYGRLLSALLLAILLAIPAVGQVTRLYNTTRGTGSIQELDLVTGAVIATNVGGITDGRGMDFSPLGGLYVTHGNNVSSIATTASAAIPVIAYVGETPHDLCFDAVGNLYVITTLNVYVYNTSMVQTLSFAHGLATTTGDGNTNKGWGIEIRPDNGEIYVVGAAGLKRFSPGTGIQIGSTIAGSSFGLAGIKFTSSGFSGVYFYVGNVISGVDQIRVYDVNLNLLRTFFAAHIGNPIDLEVNPANGDLYLFNTVVSNPANRFSSTEVVNGGFSAAANPTRGSALGSFEPILATNNLHLKVSEDENACQLTWTIDDGAGVAAFEIAHSWDGLHFETMANVHSSLAATQYGFLDARSELDKRFYRVAALNSNGESVAIAVVALNTDFPSIGIHYDPGAGEIHVNSFALGTDKVEVSLSSMNGTCLVKSRQVGDQCSLSSSGLASGIYLVQANALNAQQSLVGTARQWITILR